jgi:uncharacterized protein (DUF1697 family)
VSGNEKTYVALLRAINLGTRNRVPMARLREVVEQIGATNARTYIASGNVLFDSDLTAERLKAKLEQAIEAEFGFKCAVVVLTAVQLGQVVRHNPFRRADAKQIHVAFATGPIPTRLKAQFNQINSDNEKAAVVGRRIYMWLPHGFGQATIPGMAMSKTEPPLTIRTLRTVVALNEMAASQA